MWQYNACRDQAIPYAQAAPHYGSRSNDSPTKCLEMTYAARGLRASRSASSFLELFLYPVTFLNFWPLSSLSNSQPHTKTIVLRSSHFNSVMDVFYAYTYGTAGWLALQSLPLIVSPTIILALLNTEVREPSDLEEYFSRSLGITMLIVGALVILLSGSVPLTSSLNATIDEESPKAPYAVPTLTISFIYHAAMGFYCYGNYSTTGQSAFALGALGSGLLAAIGLWVLLFASSQGHISRKTGADKRTSGFPFNNQESASAKKKQLRKGI